MANKNFVGLSFNIPKNKYMAKPTSYQYKLSNAKKFFLTDLGNWIRSPEVQQGLKENKVLKVGARVVQKENQKTMEQYEVLEFCVFLGMEGEKIPYKRNFGDHQRPSSNDSLDDDLSGEEAPF